jgi:NAD(P)-dependent dehydrogenase (short-subunit alcohol dehydrogenase family)
MRTAVVTGVSQGLGQVIADTFAKNGWEVIGTGRSDRPDGLDAAIRYEKFDASDAKACSDFWDKVMPVVQDKEVCLVNNAGGFVGGGLLETSPEDYEKQMMSNYFAGVYMTRGLAQVIPAARIVNVISRGALSPSARTGAYGASKAAARQFFQSLQLEFKPDQYQITNLYPSDIATHGDNPNAIDPSDLANLILQAAENKSSYFMSDITLLPTKNKK